MRLLPLCLIATLCALGTAVPAWADVSGNSYDVTVAVSGGTSFPDTYTFGEDGTFTSEVGGTGTWSNVATVGGIQLWTAGFVGEGDVVVTFAGIQFSRFLVATGSNTEGTAYKVTGKESRDTP